MPKRTTAQFGHSLLHDPVVAGLLRQVQRAARDVVGGQDLALRHLAALLVGLDLPLGGVEAISRVTQEDHAKHRHEVVARSELGIGAEVIRGLPEVTLKFLNIFECVVSHGLQTLSL